MSLNELAIAEPPTGRLYDWETSRKSDGLARARRDARIVSAAWAASYGADWDRHGMTAESLAQRFSAPLRIRITDVHGH